jgi:UDP-glucuronate 4-epimerase
VFIVGILVTGGAGFIGSHLIERLLKDGRACVCLDSFDTFYSPEIKRKNIEGFRAHPDFRLVEGDIRDPHSLTQATKAMEISSIVHLAARAGVRPSLEQPLLYQDVNINGTMNLLECARQTGIKKLVFASSSSVYGNNEKVPFNEDDRVDHPISPYAATKKAGELLCHTYYHLYGIAVTCLRFFTVYGPRQRPEMAIHAFTRKIEEGRPIQIFGDGTSQRDYTYISDIIDGVIQAVNRINGYQIFNLGESKTVSLMQLIAHIEDALGKRAHVERLPEQPGDVLRTYADVSRARQYLEYDPKVTIQQGIPRFVQWFRMIRKGLSAV